MFKPSARLGPLLVDPTKPYIYRDVSWLQFNQRVLAEAADKKNPLFERLKFLSISASNLDEFFMIRMAYVHRSIAGQAKVAESARSGELSKPVDTNKAARLQRIGSYILRGVRKFHEQQRVVLNDLARDFAKQEIRIVTDVFATRELNELGEKIFFERILPDLQNPRPLQWPLLADIDNLQIFATVFPIKGNKLFVAVPKKVKSVFVERDPKTGVDYVFFLDQLLEAFLRRVLNVEGAVGVFRLTRDGDVSVELHDEVNFGSIPDTVRKSLSGRDRGRPIRLQYRGDVPPLLLFAIQKALRLKTEQLFQEPLSFALGGLWSATSALATQVSSNPKLAHPPVDSFVPEAFNSAEVFERVKRSDYLFHHPYDSFEGYIRFIQTACTDPSVVEIAQTVYRMDAISPVIEALKMAARNKRIRVVIELRARFDEWNNLKLADELRQAGADVVFGFGKLKIHSKIALVTRKEDGKEIFYTHLSTGNYHAGNAKQYTDLSIITANSDIGQDAKHFFDSVALGKVPNDFKVLVPAPLKLHKKLLQMIESEVEVQNTGGKGRIFAKVNALIDETIIEHLYRASAAGVQIDLMVRGACSLVPGLKGLSENIRVFSIVDRFLEHSRIYYFEGAKKLYLSSADWMPRNFHSRLELAFPVLSEKIFSYLADVAIPAYLADNVKSRYLSSDGIWRSRVVKKSDREIRAQGVFEQQANNEYKGTNFERKNFDSSTPRAPG
ncbi:MAG TPA: polyphosphate kinase 1 [Oligoflexia bacterium]|nr:polyphosphate kinase 1 [Oligoflexia bacterium]